MNFILAYLPSRSGTEGDAGGLALILFVALLVALGGYAVGWHIWHCPYRAVLVAGPAFLGTMGLLISISDHFTITM